MKRLGIELVARCDSKLFEFSIIEDTKQYYASRAESWIPKLSLKEFMKVLQHLTDDQHNNWLKQIQNRQVGQKLIDVIRQELSQAINNAVYIIFKRSITFDEININTNSNKNNNDNNNNSSFLVNTNTTVANMNQIAKADLHRLYNFYKASTLGIEAMATAMNHAVIYVADMIINDGRASDHMKNNNYSCILNLIKLGKYWDNFINCKLKTDSINVFLFKRALTLGLEHVVNDELYSNIFQKLLAGFCNEILTKTTKTHKMLTNDLNFDESELNSMMQEITKLYYRTKKKDVFENDYKDFLALRLLRGLSDEYHECMMISKLSIDCSYHWNKQIGDMIRDVKNSQYLTQEYLCKMDSKYEVTDAEFSLNVTVCDHACWPMTTLNGLRLRSVYEIKNYVPKELKNQVKEFDKWYKDRFVGVRRLSFQMQQGQAELRVQFSKNVNKIIVCTTYQMFILLLFNEKDIWTFKEICDKTRISRQECLRQIQSMAHPKVKILNKSPNCRQCEDNHKFKINSNYCNSRRVIHVPLFNSNHNNSSSNMKVKIEESKDDIDIKSVVNNNGNGRREEIVATQQLIKEFLREVALDPNAQQFKFDQELHF